MGKLIENLVASDKSVHTSEEVGSVIYLNAPDTFGNIVKDKYSHLVYPNICIK